MSLVKPQNGAKMETIGSADSWRTSEQEAHQQLEDHTNRRNWCSHLRELVYSTPHYSKRIEHLKEPCRLLPEPGTFTSSRWVEPLHPKSPKTLRPKNPKALNLWTLNLIIKAFQTLDPKPQTFQKSIWNSAKRFTKALWIGLLFAV